MPCLRTLGEFHINARLTATVDHNALAQMMDEIHEQHYVKHDSGPAYVESQTQNGNDKYKKTHQAVDEYHRGGNVVYDGAEL